MAALNRIDPEVGNDALGMLQTPKPRAAQAIITSLINDLAAGTTRAILVLDDYHLVESSEVNGIASFVLEHLPDTEHVVFATRTDPDIPLARLRAGGEVTEIRAKDLRFSLPEITGFLNDSMGLDLSATDVASLATRTEGWVAGLQLAALSLRGRESTTRAIGAVSGTQRYVMDQLFEEVLARQPMKIQEFLMRTAVLDRLSPSLCSAVSGKEDGAEILELLDRGNLFVIPLDGVGYWYRYHHLFAELLLHRLDRTHPDLKLELHQRAAAHR